MNMMNMFRDEEGCAGSRASLYAGFSDCAPVEGDTIFSKPYTLNPEKKGGLELLRVVQEFFHPHSEASIWVLALGQSTCTQIQTCTYDTQV